MSHFSKICAIFTAVALLFTSTACFAQDENTDPLITSTELASQTSPIINRDRTTRYRERTTPDQSPENQSRLHLNDGFYLGLSGGYDAYSFRRDTSATILGDPLFNETIFVYPSGFVGNIFLGYGYTFKKPVYIGVEGFFDLSSAYSNVSTTVFAIVGPYTYNTKITTLYSYGASLLPGVRVNESLLLYLKLGFTQSRIKEKEVESLTSAPSGVPFLNTSIVHFANGLSFGLGFEQGVYWRLSLRGDFTHTFYSSFTNTYSSFISSTVARLKPSNNAFSLALIWHFW